MAINGIGSYGLNSLYSYQSTLNNMRLSQAFTKNPKLNQYSTSRSSYGTASTNSNVGFVKQYSSTMADLMSAANALKDSNKSSVTNGLSVTSSDTSVATAEAKLSVRNTKEIKIDVQQIAQAQLNVSEGVKASAKAESDMNFTVGEGVNAVNVQVSTLNRNGTTKTNVEMLKEAANQINYSNSNVKASVVQKDGVTSLQLEGKSTGAANTFQVSGEQFGAAAGIDKVKTEAANAEYSVTSNGQTINYESDTNNVSVDYTRIGVTLKGTGKTTIGTAMDTNKAASALEDLVSAYNSSVKFLDDNYGRGSAVNRQLNNLVTGIGSEDTLKKLGITVNKDSTLSFDKSVFAKSMQKDPSLTRQLLSGTNGLADRMFNKASNAMNVNANSLMDGTVSRTGSSYSNSASSYSTDQYNVFNMYARSGAYAMNNYAAVGMMLNYLI